MSFKWVETVVGGEMVLCFHDSKLCLIDDMYRSCIHVKHVMCHRPEMLLRGIEITSF